MSGTLGRLGHPLALPVGLALAAWPALSIPGEWVAAGASSITLLALMAAIVAAKYGRPDARPYWWGFAAIGWAYVILAYALARPTNWTNRDLFTDLLLERAWLALFPQAAQNPQSLQVEHYYFLVIGHALIALGLAHAAGLLAQRLARQQAQATATTAPSTQTTPI